MPSHTIFNEREESQDRLIQFLINMGYEYVSRSEAEKKRKNLSKVLFEDELIRFLGKQSYTYKNNDRFFSGESIVKAVHALDVSLLQGLTYANKEIYHLLSLGISLEESIAIDKDIPVKQSFDLNYIDFENPHNNIWQVTEEFSVERPNGSYARPDIVIMVNGIPLAVIECKKSSVDVREGVKQNIRNMLPDYIPQLFKYAQLVFAITPNKGLYGTAGSSERYFIEWKENDFEWQKELCVKCSPDGEILEQDKLVVSLLDRKRLLDIMKNFILYDNNIKKVARHQQYFAIHKALERISGKDNADSDGGVIWHTQGSGKSLTMVMLMKMIQAYHKNDDVRFILVTDRVNLDKQIKANFVHTNMQPAHAKTGKALDLLLKDKKNTLITTLINKFETVCKNKYLETDSDKFYLFIDEAQRSQYKTMHNYMREVLPNATMIAFTGTPLIASKKKSTYKQFGSLIHSYTMKRGIEDKIIAPLVYEGRVIKQDAPSGVIDKHFEIMTKGLTEDKKEDLKRAFSRFQKLAETSSRLNLIALDIYEHFTSYCVPKKQKAMIACSSRAAAVDIFNALKSLQDPNVNPAVVITFSDKKEGEGDEQTSSSLAKIKEYREKYVKPKTGENDERYEEMMCNSFVNEEDELNILIVKDKLLTGFDAPVASVLYIDKPMKEHNLLQAIARVNRIYKGKEFGLIVDYWGVFAHLNSALELYEEAESGFNKFDKGDIDEVILGPLDAKKQLEDAHADLWDFFADIPKHVSSNTWQLALEEEKKRKEFYDKLKNFANLLNLACVHRAIFQAVGTDKLTIYQNDYSFFGKLRKAVILRYDDKLDVSRYEDGIKKLLETFVTVSEDVKVVVEPISITDTNAMEEVLASLGSADAKADAIRTRMETKLKQIRYDDPLLFEKFSIKIKNTLDEYAQDRLSEEAYFKRMENMADDFRNGTTQSYPALIANNPDSKAFYGAIITLLKKDMLENISHLNQDNMEELVARSAIKIEKDIKENTKRDWKHNEVAHKNIRKALDDTLFEMFEEIGVTIDKSNVETLDLILDEIMKVAVARF